MKHTKCKECKSREGDCGHHFKMDGITDYDIPSQSSCDQYDNCMFFRRRTRMTHLEITFKNDNVLSIAYDGEINLHTINGHYVAFDDIWVNLENVLFIRKKEEEE